MLVLYCVISTNPKDFYWTVLKKSAIHFIYSTFTHKQT